MHGVVFFAKKESREEGRKVTFGIRMLVSLVYITSNNYLLSIPGTYGA